MGDRPSTTAGPGGGARDDLLIVKDPGNSSPGTIQIASASSLKTARSNMQVVQAIAVAAVAPEEASNMSKQKGT